MRLTETIRRIEPGKVFSTLKPESLPERFRSWKDKNVLGAFASAIAGSGIAYSSAFLCAIGIFSKEQALVGTILGTGILIAGSIHFSYKIRQADKKPQ